MDAHINMFCHTDKLARSYCHIKYIQTLGCTNNNNNNNIQVATALLVAGSTLIFWMPPFVCTSSY